MLTKNRILHILTWLVGWVPQKKSLKSSCSRQMDEDICQFWALTIPQSPLCMFFHQFFACAPFTTNLSAGFSASLKLWITPALWFQIFSSPKDHPTNFLTLNANSFGRALHIFLTTPRQRGFGLLGTCTRYWGRAWAWDNWVPSTSSSLAGKQLLPCLIRPEARLPVSLLLTQPAARVNWASYISRISVGQTQFTWDLLSENNTAASE